MRTRAGLDEHTVHELRHDFAGLLVLAANVPGRVVAEMIGHANYSIAAKNGITAVPQA